MQLHKAGLHLFGGGGGTYISRLVEREHVWAYTNLQTSIPGGDGLVLTSVNRERTGHAATSNVGTHEAKCRHFENVAACISICTGNSAGRC